MASLSWRRVPMVWLLIALPALSVIGGVALLVAALISNDGLVVDDYYRRGQEINRELARDHQAAVLSIKVRLIFTDARDGVRAEVRAHGITLPSELRLQLLHATRQGNDRELTLRRGTDGAYYSDIPPLAPGRYHVQVAAADWRLLGRLQWPTDRQMDMQPDTPLAAPSGASRQQP